VSYTKRTDVPCGAGETVCQLDTGELVAVRCDVDVQDDKIRFRAAGRVIDESGAPVLDNSGRAIARSFPFPVPTSVATAEGVEAIARQCLMCILGEPGTRPGWNQSFLDSYNVRLALAAASVEPGPVDAGAVL